VRHPARALARGALLGLALAAGPAPAQFDDPTLGPPMTVPEEEKAGPLEAPSTIPPVSSGKDLVAYRPDGAGSRKHWVDRRSVSIEPPYVRVTIVVESSGGARTISHYGFDCSTKSAALLAMGAPDDGWREVSAVNWRSLTRDRRHTPYLRAVLDAACDGGGPVRTVDQMIERLGRPRMYSPY
jgi:hypothetical protein